jgi:hypothetical protein
MDQSKKLMSAAFVEEFLVVGPADEGMRGIGDNQGPPLKTEEDRRPQWMRDVDQVIEQGNDELKPAKGDRVKSGRKKNLAVQVDGVLAPRHASSEKVRADFKEQLTYLADRMASVGPKGHRILRHLKRALIEILLSGKIPHRVVETKTKLNGRAQNMVYVLFPEGHDHEAFFKMPESLLRHKDKAEKNKEVLGCPMPNVSRLVLWNNGQADAPLYVPCDGQLIPFDIDASSIRSLRGPLGRKIRDALFLDYKELDLKIEGP